MKVNQNSNLPVGNQEIQKQQKSLRFMQRCRRTAVVFSAPAMFHSPLGPSAVAALVAWTFFSVSALKAQTEDVLPKWDASDSPFRVMLWFASTSQFLTSLAM